MARGDKMTPRVEAPCVASRRVSGLEPVAPINFLSFFLIASQISQKATVADAAFHFDCPFTGASGRIYCTVRSLYSDTSQEECVEHILHLFFMLHHTIANYYNVVHMLREFMLPSGLCPNRFVGADKIKFIIHLRFDR